MKRLLIAASALALVAAGCGGSRGEVTDLTGEAAATEPDVQTIEAADGDTVEISMTEFAFAPEEINVPVGSTLTFAFENEGEVEHEAVIGDEAFQLTHEAEMAAGMDHDEGAAEAMGYSEDDEGEHSHDDEGMEHEHEHEGDEGKADAKHDDEAKEKTKEHDEEGTEHDHHADSAIELAVGEAGALEYTFDEAGTFMIGCHIPGHWDAGMVAIINVA